MSTSNPKCLKCNIQKCKAECCTWVPLRLQFLKENEALIQRPIYHLDTSDFDGYIVRCVTNIQEITPELKLRLLQRGEEVGDQKFYVDIKLQTCPFLKSDYSCAVYDIRPEICRCFGTKTEPDNTLTCHYHLGKNYHFPDKNTAAYASINNFKYLKRDFINNKKLMEEYFSPEIRRFIYEKFK